MKSVRKAKDRCDASGEVARSPYRGLLAFYAEYQLPCKCTQEILTQVECKARGVIVPDEFKVSYLLRTLVQTVIPHLRQCSRRSSAFDPNSSVNCLIAVDRLTTEERLVYFLREILEYRARDASLLLGISDAQVEKLLSFARRRIERNDQTDTLEIEYAHGQYFRWSFPDLGRW